MLLDFDPSVIGFATQPFWLFWRDHNRQRAHAPDLFARLDNGTGVVIDCRPAELLRPDDAAAFNATAHACADIGWAYRLVHAHNLVLVGNLRWLAAYRHPRHHDAATAAAVVGGLGSLVGAGGGAGRPARSACPVAGSNGCSSPWRQPIKPPPEGKRQLPTCGQPSPR
jgi:hypothetical protein